MTFGWASEEVAAEDSPLLSDMDGVALAGLECATLLEGIMSDGLADRAISGCDSRPI